MIESLQQSEPVAMTTPPMGKMLRSIVAYAFLLVAMLLTPLVVFLPAALFDCAYRNGRRVAWVVFLIATAVSVAIVVQISHLPPVTPQSSPAHRLADVFLPIVALGLPALLVAPLVQRGESFGRVLTIAMLLGIAGLLGLEGGMRAAIGFSPYAAQVVEATREAHNVIVANVKNASADWQQSFRKVTEISIYCAPGFEVVSFTLYFTLSLVLYGRLRAWREFMATREVNAASPYLFRNFVLPEWLILAFIVGGLFPLETGMLKWFSANVLAVAGFLYLLQGLAIFRSMLVTVGATAIGSLFAYAALVLLCAAMIGMPLLSITGLFDSFFDFRHFNRKDSSHEGHSD